MWPKSGQNLTHASGQFGGKVEILCGPVRASHGVSTESTQINVQSIQRHDWKPRAGLSDPKGHPPFVSPDEASLLQSKVACLGCQLSLF